MTRSPTSTAIWDDARLTNPHDQPDKAARVRDMFDAIAPTYELVNRVLSAGRDGYWRRRAVQLAAMRPDDRVLDIACGTGDFSRAFARTGPAVVIGCDFAGNMLALAARRDDHAIDYLRADALTLPFADGSFTVVSCAFGVRNFQSFTRGMREASRVLKPGGRFVILEFSVPRSALLGRLYLYYFHRVLPRLASWISGDRTGAYRYLSRSVASFVDPPGMVRALRAAGFDRVDVQPLTNGVVTVYVAWKPR